METRWVLKQPDFDLVRSLSRELDCHEAVAAALVNRDLASPDKARRFLSPALANLLDPFCFADMDKAVQRVWQALLNREKICIFGDYDADGITSTALMQEFLSALGADCSTYIPHRVDEGYGLKEEHIQTLAGNKLVITVDCGISSHKAIEMLAREGIDVVVTDHHTPGPTLPDAVAVINPKRGDCPSGRSFLAGVGVAFFLCVCIRAFARDKGFFGSKPEPNLKEFLDLVAIGTLADVVPLVEENRILVSAGLEVIQKRRRPGIAALLDVSGAGSSPITEQMVLFGLAPRINAAGRLEHADAALELLLTEDSCKASDLAARLNSINLARRSVEKEMLDQGLALLVEKPSLAASKILVLWDENWHPGVMGIVASRLAQRFNRPVALLSFQGNLAKGSARSVAGIDLHQCLTDCEDLLEAFGGHAMAAGLTLKQENLKAFVAALNRAVENRADEQAFARTLTADWVLDLNSADERLAFELDMLRPFGPGNEEPMFAAHDLSVCWSRLAGEKHLVMGWLQANSPPRQAIWFGAGACLTKGEFLSGALFHVRKNPYGNGKNVQLVAKDVR
ncbi:MAG: single-stranded-DNA-specific exonuclease RecJ [Desulfatibacillaceae bacterium]|nr:single-stranded-DNA-specific exonuclease RecJ [Desulfatibacillaceae bacterium]